MLRLNKNAAFVCLFFFIFLSSLTMADQKSSKKFLNLENEFRHDIEIATDETRRKISTRVQGIFENAMKRIDYFVEQIYDRREDDILWVKEFQRLVLPNEALNSYFSNLTNLYKEDLQKLIRSMTEQSLKMAGNKIKKLKISYKNAELDMQMLNESLPTAEEIASKIYLELEEQGLNEKDGLCRVLEVWSLTGKLDKTIFAGGAIILAVLTNSAIPILAPAAIYTAMKSYNSFQKINYKLETQKIIRQQRNSYLDLLKESYVALLVDVRGRIEKAINEAILNGLKAQNMEQIMLP